MPCLAAAVASFVPVPPAAALAVALPTATALGRPALALGFPALALVLSTALATPSAAALGFLAVSLGWRCRWYWDTGLTYAASDKQSYTKTKTHES